MATEALTMYEVLYLGSALPPASNPTSCQMDHYTPDAIHTSTVDPNKYG